jgi:hypothetical protein
VVGLVRIDKERIVTKRVSSTGALGGGRRTANPSGDQLRPFGAEAVLLLRFLTQRAPTSQGKTAMKLSNRKQLAMLSLSIIVALTGGNAFADGSTDCPPPGTTTALGAGSIACGYNDHADQDNSVAFGNNNNAGGYITFGQYLLNGTTQHAVGSGDVAMGTSNNAIGNNSNAIGQGNTAGAFHGSGPFSYRTSLPGYDTSGAFSTNDSAIGTNNSATGGNSSAVGYHNNADQANSIAFGNNNNAGGYFTFGHYSYNGTQRRWQR